MNGGCLGSGLINSHRAQLRLHSNPPPVTPPPATNPPPPPPATPAPMATHQQVPATPQLRAASLNPDLKTSTQTASVRYKRQTSDETHNSLLVLYPEWDIQRQEGSHHSFLGHQEGGKECSMPNGKWAGGFNTLCRQTRPPAAEASQPHTLGKEPKCDSEGAMGHGAWGQRHRGWRELGVFPDYVVEWCGW